MLGLFAPRVEILEVREDRLTFRSSRSLSVGKAQIVKLGTRSIRVMVESVRPLERGGYACIGQVQGDVDLPSPAQAVEDAFLRKAERRDCVMRVLSPDLPGYRAVTVDFSHGGIQVETEGPLSTGAVLDLTMEFDREGVPAIRCQARVAWSSPRARNRYRAGLQFVTPTAEVERQLAWIEQFLDSRETHSVMQRTLGGDAALFLGPPRGTAEAVREQAPTQFPLTGVLESYSMCQGKLTAWVLQGDLRVEFTFPSCRTLRDYSSADSRPLAFLRESSGSELVSQVARKASQGGWRHYQVVDAAGEVVLELVSQPAGRPGVLTAEQVAEAWEELWRETGS
ncbi:MAG: PilZ domain-containing protein [Candidatus Eremiobacterota bacterium]